MPIVPPPEGFQLDDDAIRIVREATGLPEPRAREGAEVSRLAMSEYHRRLGPLGLTMAELRDYYQPLLVSGAVIDDGFLDDGGSRSAEQQ